MNDVMITVIGTAVQDPRVAFTKSGVAVTSIRLVSNHRRFNRETNVWIDGDPTYFTVNCWRQLGEHVADSVKRGDPVVAYGRLKVREWTANEKSGTSVEVEAMCVGHDLCRGRTEFRKRTKDEQPDPWIATDPAADQMAALAQAAGIDPHTMDPELVSVDGRPSESG